jgi:hypothetical protein
MSMRLRCFLNGALSKESNRMKRLLDVFLNQDEDDLEFVAIRWYHRPSSALSY